MRNNRALLSLSCGLAVLFAEPRSLAATPEPAFSFKYDGKDVRGGASVQVGARLKVTVERTDHPDFDATEWVLWFENPSAEKSGIPSEIRDGDFPVALPLPEDQEVLLGVVRVIGSTSACIDYSPNIFGE